MSAASFQMVISKTKIERGGGLWFREDEFGVLSSGVAFAVRHDLVIRVIATSQSLDTRSRELTVVQLRFVVSVSMIL